MNYHISKPSPILSKYVKHYWSFRHTYPMDVIHSQRIVPIGLFEMIFYLNGKPISIDSQQPFSENSFISGQQTSYFDIKIAGELDLFAIYFFPQGLSMFLDLPLNEIFNQSIPLNELLKREVALLEDELHNCKSIQSRITIIEQFLLNRMKLNEKFHQFDRISHTIDLINKAKGNIDIVILANKACLSRKQFERIFSEIIGTSPKQFQKIIRFQNAIFQRSIHPHLNLTDIAYKCGYYDQAHMINDFKSLSGITPRKYFSKKQPYSDYFG